jgi:glycosyltransferase involved in cell wall biosynthesis
MPDGQDWPTISIVTPSFNQGQYIEETIRSVLLQGYPNLEYLLIDGGSTDNSVEVIKKYSRWLSYWVSEADGGQSDAINRGLKEATGEFATWINSDDLLCKDALVSHALQVGFNGNVVYIGYCPHIDQRGKFQSLHRGRVHSLEDLVRIKRVWRSPTVSGAIDQPAVLFPRSLACSVGWLDPDNHWTMDYALWGKFLLAGATFRYTDIRFGMFRQYSEQKTGNLLRTTESLIETAAKLVRFADCFSAETKKEILTELDSYKNAYPQEYWKSTGRLARIGLPPAIVSRLRKLTAALRIRLEETLG